MITQLRNRTKLELCDYLAEATELVWKCQNTLSESSDEQILKDVTAYAERLYTVSGVIRGLMARWQLLEGATKGS